MQANLTGEHSYINPNFNNSISNLNPVMVMEYHFLSRAFIPEMQERLNHMDKSKAKPSQEGLRHDYWGFIVML